MRITKYLHSCLLVEEQDTTILIDPGEYTYDAGDFTLSNYKTIDYVLITHEHADHLSLPFLKEILTAFPTVQIVSNESVVTKLQEEDIQASTQTPNVIQAQSVPHEKVFGVVVPPNTLFHMFDRLTHPGDSHSFDTTKEILALPMQAPWGHVTAALELAVQLKPTYVLPIHDWHWKDEVRKGMYKRAESYLQEHGILFKNLETGESVEL